MNQPLKPTTNQTEQYRVLEQQIQLLKTEITRLRELQHQSSKAHRFAFKGKLASTNWLRGISLSLIGLL